MARDRERSAEPLAGRALAEPETQDYIGHRDLTRWPTAAGQTAARAAQSSRSRLGPHQLLLATLLIGLLGTAALTALAAAVYDAVVEVDGVAGLDRPVLTFAVSSRSAAGTAIAAAYTTIGGPVVLPILVALVAATLSIAWRQWTPTLLIAITMAGSLTMTVVGKSLVGRTRPPFADAVAPFESGASFPSGPSLNSAALAGIVAYLLLRRQHRAWMRALTIAVAVAFAVTMGLSRVYLGHHWLTDVLVAWALGTAWLSAVVTAHRLFLTVRRGGAPGGTAGRSGRGNHRGGRDDDIGGGPAVIA